MNTSEERAKKVSLAISIAREKVKSFSRKELVRVLTNSGCPYPAFVVPMLVRKKLIHKINNSYEFSHSEPIYFGAIQKDLDEIYATFRGYQDKNRGISTAIVGKTDEVQKAIAFLKSQGFKIMKPVTNFEEC